MWRQFTENGRRALHFAQERAREMGYTQVFPEHLGWGLLVDKNSTAARVLQKLEVAPERLHAETARLAHRGPGEFIWGMTLSASTSRIIDLAYDEARQLRNKHVGTEHLLLALIRERNNPTAHILSRFGVTASSAYAVVREMQQDCWLVRPSAAPEVPARVLVRPVAGTPPAQAESLDLLRSASRQSSRQSTK